MIIGKWVEGWYLGKKVIGFVVDQAPEKSLVKITQPYFDVEVFLPTKELNIFEDSSPTPEAIEILIDLALVRKQEEWFYELCEQLETFKKIEDVKSII